MLVRKQHNKQRREQNQKFIIVHQGSAGLQTAENVTKKLLQLGEAEEESRVLLKMFKVKIPHFSHLTKTTFSRNCEVKLGSSLFACL